MFEPNKFGGVEEREREREKRNRLFFALFGVKKHHRVAPGKAYSSLV